MEISTIPFKKNGKNLKKAILPLLTILTLSSCNNTNTGNRTEDPINKHKKEKISPNQKKEIKNTYDFSIADEIALEKNEGIKFPKKLPNGDIEYYYKYGSADITILFGIQNGVQIKKIIQNSYHDLGRKQKEKLKKINKQFTENKIENGKIKIEIENILHLLIGEGIATPNKNTVNMLEYYLNGGNNEKDFIYKKEGSNK